MNIRLKQLRKQLDLTLEEFGKKLGVTKTAISRLENGERNITEQMIISICREFNVNESWLRTGEGGDENMFLKPQKNDLVAKAAVLLGQKDPVFEAFVETYSKLDPVNRKVLLDWGMDFLNCLKKHSENT